MGSEPVAWGTVTVAVVAWLAASASTGALVALVAARINPALGFVKLWRFYSVLMALTVAAVFAVAWL